MLASLLACISGIRAQQIYELKEGIVFPKMEFVEPISDALYYEEHYCVLEENPQRVEVGGADYLIRIGCYTPHSDPGDFDVIDIERGGEQVYQYRDDMGMLRMNEMSACWAPKRSHANYRFREYSSNGYFIEYALTSECKVLLFVGLPYGTDRGKTIVLVLTEDDVKVVFNKPMEIVELSMTPDNLELELISVFGETGDGVNWTPDVTHTIYTKDGMLWFKDNPVLESSKYMTFDN